MEQEHIVKSYDIELTTLRKLLLDLLEENAKQLDRLYMSISNDNKTLAQDIIDKDYIINELDAKVVELSIGILGLRNPVAWDLRFVFSSSHISRNSERMGDNIRNIAKKVLEITAKNERLEIKILESIHICMEMIRFLMYKFDSLDSDQIKEIAEKDIRIDGLYADISNQILQNLTTDPDQIASLHNYLLMSRFLERVGDHIVTICKYLNYTETGKFVQYD